MGYLHDDLKLKTISGLLAWVLVCFMPLDCMAQIGNTSIGNSAIGRSFFAPATPGISNTPVCFAPGVCSINPGCPVYIFTGVGDWRIPGNWASSVMPPETLPSCYQIIINPATNEPCVLPNPQTVMRGSSFVVMPGKKLIIPGNVFIQ